jgi:hypothetical protein
MVFGNIPSTTGIPGILRVRDLPADVVVSENAFLCNVHQDLKKAKIRECVSIFF